MWFSARFLLKSKCSGRCGLSSNKHDAAGSVVGYLYQTSWALLELISQKRADASLTLEMLDDVEWDADGSAAELIQVKHHATPGGLGNKSVDLWRTLNVWLDNGSPTQPLRLSPQTGPPSNFDPPLAAAAAVACAGRPVLTGADSSSRLLARDVSTRAKIPTCRACF
jgi:hypothetical protein